MADNSHIYHVSMNFGLVRILSEFVVTKTKINFYIPIREIFLEIFCRKISLKKVNFSDGNNPKFIFNFLGPEGREFFHYVCRSVRHTCKQERD